MSSESRRSKSAACTTATPSRGRKTEAASGGVVAERDTVAECAEGHATNVALPLVATAGPPDGGDSTPRPSWVLDRSAMALTLAVWVCTLPAVFLLVAPFLGLRAALLIAVVLLGVMAVVCWAVCASSPSWRRPGHRPQGKRNGTATM